MRAVYTTVEKVMRAADVKATAYSGPEILAAIESASQDVDNLVSQGDAQRPAFAPWVGSITFDWPTPNNLDSYKFWLNQFRLHSVTSVTSGGDNISSIALPWPSGGAPYSAIEINTAGGDAFDIGQGTGQRSLVIAGTWGTLGEDRSRSLWTLGAPAGASDDVLTVNAPAGVGSLLLIGSERMLVTERSWADSGQTIAAGVPAQMNAQTLVVENGAAFLAGETVMVDAERMLIRDVVGNLLVVARASDGSTLAAHLDEAPVFWARSLTVERGALGTSASAHGGGARVSIYHAPPIVEQLTIAYAIDRRAQEAVGYARSLKHIADRRQLSAKSVGGDVGGIGIAALEARVISAYGRIRHRAI